MSYTCTKNKKSVSGECSHISTGCFAWRAAARDTAEVCHRTEGDSWPLVSGDTHSLRQNGLLLSSRPDCSFLKNLRSFSGNLRCCFATLIFNELFPLKLKPCFTPYKHAGQIFPFLFAAAFNTDSPCRPSAFFLTLRNSSAFAFPSEFWFLPALLIAAPWNLPICPVSFWECGTEDWKQHLQHHEVHQLKGWDHFLSCRLGIT